MEDLQVWWSPHDLPFLGNSKTGHPLSTSTQDTGCHLRYGISDNIYRVTQNVIDGGAEKWPKEWRLRDL